MKFQDYYQTLGVSKTASQDEIQRAYRNLARKFHPDVNKEKSAEAKFKEITEAYEVLKDPDKRQRFDQLGSNWKSGQDFNPPPGWEQRFRTARPQSAGGQSFTFQNMGDGDFSDFFEAFFGRGASSGAFEDLLQQTRAGGQQTQSPHGYSAPGQDVESLLTLALEEAFKGGAKQLSLQMPDGSTRTLSVKIPPGVTEGSVIRLSGQGMPGSGGGEPGDLLLRINFAEHSLFEVDGHDLTTQVPVSPWEAALGAKVEVQTLDGKVTVSIPPGSQSGQKLRLRAKGLPNPKGKSPGDLLAQIKIVVPKSLTKDEQRLFEELKEKSQFNPRP